MNDDSLINTLPDDCLTHIFSFLSLYEKLKVEKVCKRWRKVGKRGWVSSKVINLRWMIPKDELYCIFQRCGRFLTTVEIRIGPGYHNCIPLIMKFCRLDRLEVIVIEHFGILLNSNGSDDSNLHRDLTALFEKTTNLIGVTITGNVLATNMDYLNILPPETLRSIEVCNRNPWICGHLSIDIHRYPKLIQLICENIVVDGTDDGEVSDPLGLTKLSLLANVSKKFIKKIQFFTGLVNLTLGDSCEIDNEDICNISKNCQNLRVLQLDCSYHMTSVSFQLLGKIPFLEQLILGQVNDYDDIQYLTNVKSLLLIDGHVVDKNDGLLLLIANSSNLEHVVIGNVDIMSRTFVEELGNIFKSGQRKEPLRMRIETLFTDGFNAESEGSPHPLLDLEIEITSSDLSSCDSE